MVAFAELDIEARTDQLVKAKTELRLLVSAAGDAEKSTDQFTRATDKSEAALSAMQRQIAAATGLLDRATNSARESAGAFDELARMASGIDQLRASIDPVYASSMRYSQALEQLDTALERGVVSQRQYNVILAQAERAYLQSGTAVRGHRTAMDGLIRSSQGGAGGLQNVGFQVQDFAVQVAAGTSATQALAQQLPQLLSSFGLLGIALGTASAVLIPIAGYFLSSSDAAKTFEESLEGLTSVTSALGDAQDILTATNAELTEQYGTYAATVRDAAAALVELQSAQAAAALSDLIVDNAEALDLFTGQLSGIFQSGEASWEVVNRLTQQFGITREEANGLRDAFRDLRFAADWETQQAALGEIQRLMAQTGISAEQLPAPLRAALIQYNQLTIAGAELQAKADQANGVLRQMPPILQSAMTAANSAAAAVGGIGNAAAGAIGQVQGLAMAMWDMAQARIQAERNLAAIAFENSPGGQALNRYGGRGTTSNRPVTLGTTGQPIDGGIGGGVGSGGGGGGAASDGFEDQLAALVEQFETEREIIDTWYEESQAILADRRALEILGAEEHARVLLEVEEELQRRKAELRDQDLGHYQSFFGAMAGALQAGGGKMLAISKGFALAEAAVSMYRGAAKALELPFPASLAAWGQVIATGMKSLSGIRGASFGNAGSTAGGGGGSRAPADVPSQQERIVRLDVRGDGMFADMLRESGQAIIDAVMNEKRAGGTTVIMARA